MWCNKEEINIRPYHGGRQEESHRCGGEVWVCGEGLINATYGGGGRAIRGPAVFMDMLKVSVSGVDHGDHSMRCPSSWFGMHRLV